MYIYFTRRNLKTLETGHPNSSFIFRDRRKCFEQKLFGFEGLRRLLDFYLWRKLKQEV